jgi:hypothetical protein
MALNNISVFIEALRIMNALSIYRKLKNISFDSMIIGLFSRLFCESNTGCAMNCVNGVKSKCNVKTIIDDCQFFLMQRDDTTGWETTFRLFSDHVV